MAPGVYTIAIRIVPQRQPYIPLRTDSLLKTLDRRAFKNMDDLYRDYILDHYKQPRNFGELEPHDLEAHEHNPLCGDELGVHIRVRDGRIEDLRFQGHGCAISQASASIASEELKGMELSEVEGLGADWMIELLGIPVSATRRKCALLNLKVVRGAVSGDHAWPT
jgi:nitrogen fixation protein NifU and related proteins